MRFCQSQKDKNLWHLKPQIRQLEHDMRPSKKKPKKPGCSNTEWQWHHWPKWNKNLVSFIYIFFEVFVARRIGHTGSRKQITIFDTKSSTFLFICVSQISFYLMWVQSWGWFNMKMPPYHQCGNSHCGDKTILRPSYLHNGISYTGEIFILNQCPAGPAVAHCKTVEPPYNTVHYNTVLDRAR